MLLIGLMLSKPSLHIRYVLRIISFLLVYPVYDGQIGSRLLKLTDLQAEVVLFNFCLFVCM